MNKIKKIIALLLFGSIHFVAAQQRPFFTQYGLNPFISNPALAGIESYWDVKLSYRNQWLGIEGEPQTFYLSAHGPLKKKINIRETFGTISPPGKKNPTAEAYWRHYKPVSPHGGAGFTLLSDRAGPVDFYTVNAAYAYHIGLNSKTSLSAGMTAGVQGIRVHTDELNFGPVDPNDPAISADDIASKIKPDLSLGLWLYSTFYFAGVSIQHVAPFKVSYAGENNVKSYGLLVPHTTVTVGYKIFINKDISFLPSTIIRVVQHTPPSFDINAKFQYQKIAWVGTSYRYSKSFAAMFGININSTINFGYSYDITTSGLKDFTHGTHEVIIGLLLGNRHHVLCPKDYW